MNSKNSNADQTHTKIEKTNRANQINTHREPTAWIEISEDQLPENLKTDDNDPKVIEFCKIIREHGTDNLIILKEQLLHSNGPPDSSLPSTAHRCIFWKEIDLSPHTSENVIKEQYTAHNTMDSISEDLSIESCEKMHKQCSQNPDKCCVDAQVACAMSQEFLKLLKYIIEQGPKGQTQCKQNANMSAEHIRNLDMEMDTQTTSNCTYKCVHDFGRVVEAYPMSFGWFSKKTDENENSPDHRVIEKDILLENGSNENIMLGSSLSTTVKNISNKKKPADQPLCCPTPPSPPLCPPPCPPSPCPPPPCPLPPPCPPQSCDPDIVKIRCSSGNVDFKLQCKKLPIDCQNTDIRYECELIDEGKCLDSKLLESCDLKCERIEAVFSDQPNLYIETLNNVNGTITTKEIDNPKDDNQKKVSTMICTKDGVDFTLKCRITTPDPDFPSNIRFLCEVDEEDGKKKVSSNDILNTAIKCRQVSNVINDSVSSDENGNQNLKNENEIKIVENSTQYLEEKYKRSDDKINDITERKKIYACRSKPKIGKEEHESDKSYLFVSANFATPNKNMKPDNCEQPTSIDHFKSMFLENHNKTMSVLKTATNDLLCTISDAKKEVCETSATKIPIKDCTNVNKLECVNAAKESCEKLTKGTKELTKGILDNLANQSNTYICTENDCQKVEILNHKLHEINGNSTSNLCVESINNSVKDVNNDSTIQNVLNEQASQQKDKHEKTKPTPVKLINESKKWSQEEIQKTVITVKKSCEDLYDKMCKTTQRLSANTSKALNDVSSKSMKWFDGSSSNGPSTGTKNVKKVLSGLTLFQSEEKIRSEGNLPSQSEENLPSRPNWTDSIHFALTSLGDTFRDVKPDFPEKSSPYDKPPRQMKYSAETEESTPISSMFATLKEKICSMFYDHNESESTSSSSNFSDISDLSDEQR